MKLTLQAITQTLDGIGAVVHVPAPAPELLATSLTWDSRTAVPQGVYLAHRGEHANGNDYIAAAIKAGSVLVIATREPDPEIVTLARNESVCLLTVQDELPALWAIAKLYREQLDCLVVGITGSVGKTSTKEFVAAVLRTKFKTAASTGNHNNEYGLPATILAADPDVEVLVLEMGMLALGEIATLADIARPRIGIITNIGITHLERLGTQENIAIAKSELLAALPSHSGLAILPGDDPMIPFVCDQADCYGRDLHVARFGLGIHNDVRICNLQLDNLARPTFDLWPGDGESHKVHLQMTGAHNALNAVAAATVGVACKIDTEQIVAALQSTKPAAMRQELLTTQAGVTIISDAYNASPESVRSALESLAQMEGNDRKVAVLGDMAELGANEIEYHLEIGRVAFASGLDVLITVGSRAEHIAKAAIDAGMLADNVIITQDAATATAALQPYLQAKTAVLVKASRSMALEQVVEGIR